jgi:putative endonuclease
MKKCPAVYIVTNKPFGTLYVGVTAFPAAREWQHKSGQNADSFTARYKLHTLVYLELLPTMPEAIAREKELKGWTRNRKLKLICKANEKWEDLGPLLHDLA